MATKRAVPKFRSSPRPPSVARRSSEATLRCLKEYGHEGVSVRRIQCRRRRVHWIDQSSFPEQSGLVAVAYETLALSLQDSIRAQADNKGRVAGAIV